MTGVCSTRKIEMVRSIGADYVIDYRNSEINFGKYGCCLAGSPPGSWFCSSSLCSRCLSGCSQKPSRVRFATASIFMAIDNRLLQSFNGEHLSD